MKNILFILLLFNVHFGFAQSISDLLSPAFPSELVKSHDGNLVAWVFNSQGARNIYVGSPDKNSIVPITQFIGDEGLEINSLLFSDNDSKIYFVRGNTTNLKGEAANPAQLQYTTEQNIYVVDIATRVVKKVAQGNAPKLSPDGKILVFLKGGKAWKVNTEKDSSSVQPLFLSRGTISGLQFNSSGTALLFVSSRDEHAFIGVYEVASNKIYFPDPSTYEDADPVWNSDGTKIAFVRQPFVKNEVLFAPKLTAQPWQIRVVNLLTKKAFTVFKADEGVGSVFVDDLPAGIKLLWTKDDFIIFPWEKTGYVHLYSVELNNKKVTHLTPGIGEVESVSLSKDKKDIIYVSNILDSNRRHIWKVNPFTQTPINLTKGKKIEYSPVEMNGGMVYLQATATRPSWPIFQKNDGVTTILNENEFPRNFPSNLVTPTTILIKATDNVLAPAQLFLPLNYNPLKKYPAVIFLHGGSRRQMLEGFNYSTYYSNAYALNEYFALNGYIVMALNYRSGIGYGLQFREAKNYGMTGATEVNDLIGAGVYLKSRKDVDASRIGLWGGSYGGFLTAHGLARRSDLFSVGVDIHGVHNWNDEEPTFTPWYDSLRMPAFGQIAYKASPINFVKGWKSPVLFMHGDDDRNVPFTETVHMIHQLRKQGVEVEEKVLPDEIHSFLLYNSWLKVDEATFEFINRKFKK